jgi:hypothetical protein
MKRLLFIIPLLFAVNCWGAELLVKANGHWMDSLTQAEVDKLDKGALESYEARAQKGDIIVVRPDGWKWGKEECLPNFIIVKVPQMSEAEAKQYESSLYDRTDPQNQIMLRVRKNAMPKTDVTAATTGTVSLSKTSLTSKVIVKTGATSEVSAPSKDIISYLWRKYNKPFVVAYHYWIENAYAATQLKKTVKPSGGDYTSLEACMHANEQNLVTADKYFDVEIDGAWSSADASNCVIHNYTTDATRYINIYTTSAARHLGVWSTSYYRIVATGGNTPKIDLYTNYTRITGLQLHSTETPGGTECAIIIQTGGGNNCWISKCILRGGRYSVWLAGTDSPTVYFWNNIIYTASVGAFVMVNGNPTVNIYSSTFIGTDYGIRNLGGTAVVKNCYAYGTTSYVGCTITTSASSDASTGTAGLRSIAYTTANFTNVTANSEDLHLVLGSALIDVGTNTSGDSAPLNFTDDIDGVTRSGTWDIGADEYVSAGGAASDWQIF